MSSTLQELEARRDAVLCEMARLGDMRAGSISENYRTCAGEDQGNDCPKPDLGTAQE